MLALSSSQPWLSPALALLSVLGPSWEGVTHGLWGPCGGHAGGGMWQQEGWELSDLGDGQGQARLGLLECVPVSQ